MFIAGWFSFEQMGTTAGDLIACDLVSEWLKAYHISHDISLIHQFSNRKSVRWEDADASNYTHVIFVCGPFGNGWPLTDFLEKFSNCKLVGINISLLESLDTWNPFFLLLERDSSRSSNPDITFLGPPPKIPVAGLILAHKQKEYGDRALHEKADDLIRQFIDGKEVSIVPIDTALEHNSYGLRTPGEVESLIAKMDLVITTRLHGTVLSLKNGVPVIPIDPINGGAKITRQVQTIGWPVLLPTETLSTEKIEQAFQYCLTPEAKTKAISCASDAAKSLDQSMKELLENLTK